MRMFVYEPAMRYKHEQVSEINIFQVESAEYDTFFSLVLRQENNLGINSSDNSSNTRVFK